MAIPRDWNPAEAVATCLPATPWSGEVWRGHNKRYDPLSHEGSLRRSGRYHRAIAEFPDYEIVETFDPNLVR